MLLLESLEQLNRAMGELEQEQQDVEAQRREEIARAVTGRLHSMLAEQQLITAETRLVHELRPGSTEAKPAEPTSSDDSFEDGSSEEPTTHQKGSSPSFWRKRGSKSWQDRKRWKERREERQRRQERRWKRRKERR